MNPDLLSAAVIGIVVGAAVYGYLERHREQRRSLKHVPAGTQLPKYQLKVRMPPVTPPRKCHELDAQGNCPECEAMGLGEQHVTPASLQRHRDLDDEPYGRHG